MLAVKCAIALATLGMTVQGDAPPPPPPEIPAVEAAPVIQPAIMLPSMKPATVPLRSSLIA